MMLMMAISLVRIRFNRYMVECEYIRRYNVLFDLACFNRYMVECE